jgi:hypothetical protein
MFNPLCCNNIYTLIDVLVGCLAFGFSSSSPRSSLHSSTSSLASQSLPTMGTSPPTGVRWRPRLRALHSKPDVKPDV